MMVSFVATCLLLLAGAYQGASAFVPFNAQHRSSGTELFASRRDVFSAFLAAGGVGAAAAFPSVAVAKGEQDFINDPRGFSYKILTPGTSDGPTARGQPVTCGYTLSLDGFVEGSSSPAGRTIETSVGILGDKPITFPVAVGKVVKGWDYAVKDMKVGERRLVIIPPELGYGKASMGGGLKPNIEPGSTLYFDITLKSIGSVPVLTDVQKKWLEENPE